MKPLESFAGRQLEIQNFAELLDVESAQWVMLVTGLSGTGKSLLIDLFRKRLGQEIPHARVQITPNTTPVDFLRLAAAQLNPDFADELADKLDEFDQLEQARSVVTVSPSIDMNMDAKLGSSITHATQNLQTNIDLDSAIEQEELAKETRRLDALIKVLRPLRATPWVLFIDETEHLLGSSDFARFLLDRLIPRLHIRFPGFRLYLTGQRIPERASFSPHECMRSTLGPLNENDTISLLEKAGVTDPSQQQHAITITSGHPLLLGMLLEEIDGASSEAAVPADLPAKLEESAVTEWIYSRVIERMPPSVRPICTDLALLDWFDLSIVRGTFATELAENDFRDLVQRAFIKEIAPGQWRCHDLIRKHLSESRRNTDPERVAQVAANAFKAFRDQMELLAENHGNENASRYLDCIRGALSCVCEYSEQTAMSFIIEQLLDAISSKGDEYIFGLIRVMTDDNLPGTVLEFGRQARRFIERLNWGEADETAVSFTLNLAARAAELGNDDLADNLTSVALDQARQAELWDEAILLAGKMGDNHPKLDYELLVVNVLGEAGRLQEAREQLDQIEASHGESGASLITRGLLYIYAKDLQKAQASLTDAIATDPENASTARLLLGRILSAGEHYEEALAQVERLLESDPGHQDALSFRMDLLTAVGRFEDINFDGSDLGKVLRTAEDQLAELVADEEGFNDMLVSLSENPEAIPIQLLLQFGERIAMQGDAALLKRVHDAILQQAPEAQDLLELQQLKLLLRGEDDGHLIERAESVNEKRPDLPGTYFVLAAAYQKSQRISDTRAVLGALATEFPSLKDRANHLIVNTWVDQEDKAGALTYIEALDKEDQLSAELKILKARLLTAEQPAKAIKILEEITLGAGRNELSTSGMIEARSLLARLYGQTDNLKSARRIADELVELFPDNSKALGAAIELYWLLKDPEAIRKLRASRDLPAVVSVGALGMLAQMHMRDLSNDEIVAVLEKDPSNQELITAIQYRAAQLPGNEATKLIEKLNQTASKIAQTLQTAQIEAMLDSPQGRQQAILMLRAPGLPGLMRSGLANILAKRNLISLEEARASFNNAAKESPELASMFNMLEVDLLLDAEEYDAAGALLEQLGSPENDDEPKLIRRVRHLEKTGKWQAAAALLDNAVTQFPENEDAHYERRIDILVEHDPRSALLLLDDRAAHGSLPIGLSMSKSNAHGKLEEYAEAVQTMKAALEANSLAAEDRALALRVKAKWEVAADQHKTAIQTYKDSLSLGFNRPITLIGLSKAQEAEGNRDEAYASLREAVTLKPHLLLEHEKRLQDLRDPR